MLERSLEYMSTRRSFLPGMFISLIVIFLLFYRLISSPAPWFDEGVNLQVAKNLALYGQYAMRSGDVFDPFSVLVSTGPTVIAPIALIFRLAGVGIFQGRLVITIYSLMAVLVFYYLLRLVYTKKVAYLGVIILIFSFPSNDTSFIIAGRQVLGEVPALAFFWLGALIWFKAVENSQYRLLAMSGVFWGLAMITKPQFIIPIAFSLLFFLVYDWLTLKNLRPREALLPLSLSGLCVAIWYGFQVVNLGANALQHSQALGSGGLMHFLRFSPRHALGNLSRLLDVRLAVLGLPAMLWCTVVAHRARNNRLMHLRLFLVSFTMVWIVWFVFFSIGWERHMLPAVAMLPIFLAVLLDELWTWAGRGPADQPDSRQVSPFRWAIGSILLVIVISGSLLSLKSIAASPDKGLQSFARYLGNNMSRDVLIESLEYELDIATDHNYHHPPGEVVFAYIEHFNYGKPIPAGLYDVSSCHPAYLVEGPFARGTGIYGRDIAERGSLVVSIGEYRLYRLGP